MYDRTQACIASAKHLPSLEALLRLQQQIEEQVASVQENRSANTHKWLSGQEVNQLIEQITKCLYSPTGFDLMWLLLPHLIEVVKESDKATAPP